MALLNRRVQSGTNIEHENSDTIGTVGAEGISRTDLRSSIRVFNSAFGLIRILFVNEKKNVRVNFVHVSSTSKVRL